MLRFKIIFSLALALLAVSGHSFFSSAASYSRTSLQDMTQRAAAVAEIRVICRSYPESADGEFQRTYVEVAIQKTLKGSLPENLTLDLPGGMRGNQVFFVADSAEFQIGEQAMVFIKEPQPGQFMVQDLGLGKFNIVQRGDKKFVESAVCPKAMEALAAGANKGAADLLTKSIPYNDFCALISAYATNEEPAISPVKLAMMLPASGAHICDPNKPCIAALDVMKNIDASKQTHQGLNLALCFVFMSLCAASVVIIRRRNAKNAPVRASIKSVALVLCASLLAGAALGGSWSLAYVASGPVWSLDDTSSPAKVSSAKIIWKQSVQGSKTNSNCFADVQSSFDKWAGIANCRLSFTNGGTTTNTVHSSSDGVNFLVWDPNPSSDFSAATLGITYSVYTVGSVSNFIDADIVFNDRDFSWGPGGAGNTKSVSLHEIGHFIGLAHTSDSSCVMYPIDRGYLQLTSDEILAAQTFYPGKNTGTTPPPPPANNPPIASLSASPVSGPSPLNCGFDASASTPGTSAIASYNWNYGDGASGSGKTTGHMYSTPGTYNAIVTVTDSTGANSTATVTVNVAGASTPPPQTQPQPPVGSSGTILKGSFKLAFAANGRDSFSTIILSDSLPSYAPAGVVNGTVTIAGTDYPFSYDPSSRKAFGSNGMKLSVSPRTGLIVITLKNTSLQSAFASVGAKNDNVPSASVNVPVNIVFGDGSQLALQAEIPFSYSAVLNRTGMGRY